MKNIFLSRPPQVLDQRIERRGLRLHHPEFAEEAAEVIQQLIRPAARRSRARGFP